jgi:hypothetical protein
VLGTLSRSRVDGRGHRCGLEVRGRLRTVDIPRTVIKHPVDDLFVLDHEGETVMRIEARHAFLVADGLRGRVLLACMRVLYVRTGRARWVVAR